MENDIVLNGSLGDVSRAHLIVEWNGAPLLRITDLSSAGTFVEPIGEAGGADDAAAPEDSDGPPTAGSRTGKLQFGVVRGRGNTPGD